MQGFADTCRSQSAQIYVDYEQVAPVARCRESRAVSPMNSSASVDHPPSEPKSAVAIPIRAILIVFHLDVKVANGVPC